jgi:hypothetical protein
MGDKSFITRPPFHEKFLSTITRPYFKLDNPILAPPLTSNYQLVGIAFDYLLRFYLERINIGSQTSVWAAEEGVILLDPLEGTSDTYEKAKSRPVQKIAPNLKGLDLKSAEAKAREVGCSVQQMGTRWDLPGTLGTIVEQIPGAGEPVPLDFPIGVVMSIEDPDKAFWEEKRKRVH